jgi:NAD dependent epimerase/dehydratase
MKKANKKRALVTGADGFIGSHLTELLVFLDYEVRVLVQYNSFNSLGWLETTNCLDQIEIISGDIRDFGICEDLVQEIDIVFHLAALIAIPYSYRAPASYLETNVNGTFNICQAASKASVGKMVVVSTSEVYGTARYVPIDESHPLTPQSPYSASKIGAEAIAMSFWYASQVPIIVARPFNTFGPRQSARAVIPSVITQIASGRKIIQVGDLTPTRDFNYVVDTCRGLEYLGRSSAIGRIVNIGSNLEISIEDTCNLIKELMGSDARFSVEDQRLRPTNSEVFRLWCDNSLIRELTGFQPEYDLRSGLRETIDWFLKPNNLAQYKTEIFNV